ncbi:hypothetical protein D3C79_913630 [compost metagenome]
MFVNSSQPFSVVSIFSYFPVDALLRMVSFKRSSGNKISRPSTKLARKIGIVATTDTTTKMTFNKSNVRSTSSIDCCNVMSTTVPSIQIAGIV